MQIRGDRDDVFSRGFICPKGSTLKHLHEDPDRVRTPVVKRDGSFFEVSCCDAFAEIERLLLPALESYGRECLALYQGNPTLHNHAVMLHLRELRAALGTTIVYSASTVDQMRRHVSSGLLCGDLFALPIPDLDHTD